MISEKESFIYWSNYDLKYMRHDLKSYPVPNRYNRAAFVLVKLLNYKIISKQFYNEKIKLLKNIIIKKHPESATVFYDILGYAKHSD